MKVLHWSSLIQLCLVFDWRWEFLLCFLLQLRCFGVAGMQFWKDFLHGKERRKKQKDPPWNFLNLKNGQHFHIEDSLPWCPQDFPNQTYTQNKYPAYTTSNSTRRSATSPSVHLAALIFETAPGFFRVGQMRRSMAHGCGKWKISFQEIWKGTLFCKLQKHPAPDAPSASLEDTLQLCFGTPGVTNLHPNKAIVSIRIYRRERERVTWVIFKIRDTHIWQKQKLQKYHMTIYIYPVERERDREEAAHMDVCMSLDTFANKNACWIVVKMYVLQHSSDSNAFSSTQNKPTSFTFQIFYSNILAKCNL